MLALGATHADIGQGDETWVVLADPEGNEFCILTHGGYCASCREVSQQGGRSCVWRPVGVRGVERLG